MKVKICCIMSVGEATFLLTALRTADAIGEQHARCRTTTIQLVDELAHAELRRLRERWTKGRHIPGLDRSRMRAHPPATAVLPLRQPAAPEETRKPSPSMRQAAVR